MPLTDWERHPINFTPVLGVHESGPTAKAMAATNGPRMILQAARRMNVDPFEVASRRRPAAQAQYVLDEHMTGITATQAIDALQSVAAWVLNNEEKQAEIARAEEDFLNTEQGARAAVRAEVAMARARKPGASPSPEAQPHFEAYHARPLGNRVWEILGQPERNDGPKPPRR